MKILLVHQNFPGQFKHLGPALVAQGHTVWAFSMRSPKPVVWQGVQVLPYAARRGSGKAIHPWVVDFETKIIRAEAALRHALALKAQGMQPDLILAHPGWGESLFLKDVWPHTKLAIYCEYHYQEAGLDVGFDPEFAVTDPGDVCRVRVKNLNNDMHLATADAGLSPTHWQASTFPKGFQTRITVAHDGIDTQALVPNPLAQFAVSTSLTLTRADEVVTFVNRNLEPYRGYHVFMRLLPELLATRPHMQVVLVGGDGVSYGAAPRQGTSWKQQLIDEVRPRICDADWSRVHFVGKLAHERFVALMQVSTLHVYLTYPFVLSWSLLEAMSMGAAVVASDTAPVREVLQDGQNGCLVPFFETARWLSTVQGLLDDPAARVRLGSAARATVVQRFDLQTVCLPAQLAWVNGLLPASARKSVQ